MRKPGEAFLDTLIRRYRTEARWLKAIQHLKEENKLVDGPEDIGPLLLELQGDFLAEETDDIKDRLFDEFVNEITRGVTQGFPQFYKALLAGGATTFQQHQINKTNEQT